MKLSELESDILAAITLRADTSVDEIAKLVGCRAHSCRRVVDKLIQRGAITRRFVINPARIGFQCFGMWFSISAHTKAETSTIIKALTASEAVSYVGECSGEFELRIDILARSAQEVDTFISAFSKKFEDVFSNRRLLCTLSIRDFSLKSLTRLKHPYPAICVDFSQEPVALSAVDHRILHQIAADGNLTQAALARKLGMPMSTVSFRLNSLRKKEVIVGSHMLPEIGQLHSYELFFQLHRIRLSNPDEHIRSCLLDFATKDPAVYVLTQCIGDIDVEMCSATRSPDEAKLFVARLKKRIGKNLLSHTSLHIVKHHKVNAYPFAPK